MTLRQEIVDHITEATARLESAYFRAPLVGFASAADPRFAQLKQIVGEHHLLPTDILPEAKTAVAFFLPFAPEVVNSNRGEQVSRLWAETYLAANAAIDAISDDLVRMLASREIPAAGVAATHTYDPVSLTASWSHRSVAFIAGLGRFGLNRMLITPLGCAGRYGSVLIDAVVTPDAPADDRKEKEPCSWFREGSCGFCIANCPTKALSETGIDRHRCNDHLLKISEGFSDLGLCDVCGKCAVGPCAMLT